MTLVRCGVTALDGAAGGRCRKDWDGTHGRRVGFKDVTPDGHKVKTANRRGVMCRW